jgi:DNA-binding beta-propeller fold protein YncE
VTAFLALAAGSLLLALCGGCGTDVLPEPPARIFGRTGMGPGEFSYPRAAVAAGDAGFYVVDKAARIQLFAPTGAFVRAWDMPEKSAGKPTGLGLTPDGRVLVADTHYSRVLTFTPAGELIRSFGTFGEAPGQFGLPTDVVVDDAGCVWVSEYGLSDRITKFSPEGTPLMTIGDTAGGIALRRPQGMVPGANNSIWVSDACNHRICRFSADGELLLEFGRSGRGAGELRFPYGMDWLSDGTLVVAEYGNNRIQRFSTDGRSLGVWGTAGRGPGELSYPWAVAVLPEDRIAVIDSGNNRVQIIDGRAENTWQAPAP